MRNGHVVNLFERHPTNPILTAGMWPYACNSVFNCGAVRLEDGSTLLLVRVEDRRGISHLTVARSANGYTDWHIDPKPTLLPDEDPYSDEKWGIEDPRVVYIPELGQYSITYTGYFEGGPHVKMALTSDFKNFDKIGSIIPPEDKDASLFPRRFDGKWLLVHRPVSTFAQKADMWISQSPDLVHWGVHQEMLAARHGAWWDANKIGLSPPPLETDEGWLVMYHGVRMTPAGCIYRQGLALFDLEDPSRLLLRGSEWIFAPEAEYERHGDVGYVVFPCGWTLGDDGDELRLYYGCADTSVGVATGSLKSVLGWLREHGSKPYSLPYN